ncbi:hypothetical protein BDY24DRAFT_418545 [Mrakia frigida]|uniref:uncharacterized protein n=1 Tax=Mrakia frigida TaxID=29902 RepID=UPI003FCC0908
MEMDWKIVTGSSADQIISIIALEHELSEGAVNVFMKTYPVILVQGWVSKNVLQSSPPSPSNL